MSKVSLSIAYLATLLFVLPTCGFVISGNASIPIPADTTVVLRSRPTVVAFFGVSEVTFMAQGLSQVLTDFHDGVAAARPALQELGIDVHEVFAQTIRVRAQEREWDLPIGTSIPIGYYFWAPQSLAYVCRGVRTGTDLLMIMRAYLEEARNGPRGALAQCERVDG